jgi:phosphoserine aminotransferase
MNFLHTSADYLSSGEWSKKAVSFGKEVGKINVVASSEASNFDHSPLPANGNSPMPPTISTSAPMKPCTAIACRSGPSIRI